MPVCVFVFVCLLSVDVVLVLPQECLTFITTATKRKRSNKLNHTFMVAFSKTSISLHHVLEAYTVPSTVCLTLQASISNNKV